MSTGLGPWLLALLDNFFGGFGNHMRLGMEMALDLPTPDIYSFWVRVEAGWWGNVKRLVWPVECLFCG